MSCSRGSSWPRDRTLVYCVAGRFFTVWATREGRRCFIAFACIPLTPEEVEHIILSILNSPVSLTGITCSFPSPISLLIAFLLFLLLLKDFVNILDPKSFVNRMHCRCFSRSVACLLNLVFQLPVFNSIVVSTWTFVYVLCFWSLVEEILPWDSSLAVQWLTPPPQGVWVPSLVAESRSHVLRGMAKK